MKRRSFIASIFALFGTPFILKKNAKTSAFEDGILTVNRTHTHGCCGNPTGYTVTIS